MKLESHSSSGSPPRQVQNKDGRSDVSAKKRPNTEEVSTVVAKRRKLDLPPEVIKQIFEHMEPDDLFQGAWACGIPGFSQIAEYVILDKTEPSIQRFLSNDVTRPTPVTECVETWTAIKKWENNKYGDFHTIRRILFTGSTVKVIGDCSNVGEYLIAILDRRRRVMAMVHTQPDGQFNVVRSSFISAPADSNAASTNTIPSFCLPSSIGILWESKSAIAFAHISNENRFFRFSFENSLSVTWSREFHGGCGVVGDILTSPGLDYVVAVTGRCFSLHSLTTGEPCFESHELDNLFTDDDTFFQGGQIYNSCLFLLARDYVGYTSFVFKIPASLSSLSASSPDNPSVNLVYVTRRRVVFDFYMNILPTHQLEIKSGPNLGDSHLLLPYRQGWQHIWWKWRDSETPEFQENVFGDPFKTDFISRKNGQRILDGESNSCLSGLVFTLWLVDNALFVYCTESLLNHNPVCLFTLKVVPLPLYDVRLHRIHAPWIDGINPSAGRVAFGPTGRMRRLSPRRWSLRLKKIYWN